MARIKKEGKKTIKKTIKESHIPPTGPRTTKVKIGKREKIDGTEWGGPRKEKK